MTASPSPSLPPSPSLAPSLSAHQQNILTEARRWLGTPWHHQASRCGVGADCLGLVRGVYRVVCRRDPHGLPSYPRFVPPGSEETILNLAHDYLEPLADNDYVAGAVGVFRMHPDLPARHLGIVTETNSMIHAVSDRAVLELALTPWWRRRCVALFAFPESSTTSATTNES